MLMAAGAAASGGPELSMLDALFAEEDHAGPLALELDVTEDLSSLRPLLAKLRGRPFTLFLKQQEGGVKLHPFLEFVAELEEANNQHLASDDEVE
jgi:hypothetical protein